MSQENVEVIRRGFAAWERGDMDAWLELVDPEVEWDNSGYPAVGVPAGGIGRESFVRFLERYRATWNEYKATLKEVVDAGDDVVLVIHESVRAGGSNASIERDLVQAWTVEGGHATRYRAFQTRAQALEAVGFSE